MLRQLTCSCAGPSALSQAPRFELQHKYARASTRHRQLPSRRCGVVVRADGKGPGGVLDTAAQGASNFAKAASQLLEEVVDDNVLPFCSLDETGARVGKQSLGEKEQQFLNALASFYYDDQPVMTNEEFDNLKEELIWEGSRVAVLSPAEQRFMEASMAYTAGKGYLSDDEYDDLKKQLQEQNSKVVQQGPRCSLRSRTMYSDCSPDYLKITALNLPNVVLVLLALFAVDDYTGFEITQLLELPQPWSIIITWGVVLPLVFIVASALTNFVLKDALILKGPCPNCGTENSTYFGDILTVRGNRENNTVSCDNCKSKMTFRNAKRQIIIQNDPDEGKGAKKSAQEPKQGGQKAEPQPA